MKPKLRHKFVSAAWQGPVIVRRKHRIPLVSLSVKNTSMNESNAEENKGVSPRYQCITQVLN